MNNHITKHSTAQKFIDAVNKGKIDYPNVALIRATRDLLYNRTNAIYEEIECLNNSGGYIDTKIAPTPDVKVYSKFKFATVDDANKVLFGASDKVNTVQFYMYKNDNNKMVLRLGGDGTGYMFLFTPSSVMTIDFWTEGTTTRCKVNNETQEAYKSTLIGPNINNLYIFNRGDNTIDDNNTANAALCYFKVYDGDTIVRDFVPARLKTNISASLSSQNKPHYKGELGLWDKVEGKFYASANEHKFVEPIKYQELEYLENINDSYIKTNYKISQNAKITIEYRYNEVGSGQIIFGARTGYPAVNAFDFQIQDNLNGYNFVIGDILCDLGNTTPSIKNVISFTKTTCIINGKTISVPDNTFSGGTLPIFIFTLNNNGSTYYPFKGKIYNLKVEEGDNIVHNFVPVKLLAPIAAGQCNINVAQPVGTLGLIDKVTGIFYANSGTSAFKGDVKPYEKLDYIENEMLTSTTGSTICVDTDAKYENTLSLDCEVLPTSFSNNDAVFGSKNENMIYIMYYNSKLGVRFGNSNIAMSTISAYPSERHIYSLYRNATESKIKFGIDDTYEDVACEATAGALPQTCYIGGRLASGDRILPIKIYNFKVTREDKVIHNYIPVRLTKDICKELSWNNVAQVAGAIGMWDTVTGKFYGNAGAGQLYAPKYNKPWKALEYIENTSEKEYIDTLIKCDNTYEYNIDYAKVDFTPGGYLFGGAVTVSSGNMWVGIYATEGYAICGKNDTTGQVLLPNDANRHNVIINNTECKCDGVSIKTWTSAQSYTSSNNLLLFARQGQSSMYLIGKIYRFVLKQSNTVKFYGIPCTLITSIDATQASDGAIHTAGEVGMWDLVSNKFFGNQNTGGSFIAGPDVE